MTTTASPRLADRNWPRSTTLLLLLLGLLLSAASFWVVMSMPDMAWHPARDAELRSTYDAYLETSTLLVKETGSGSYGVQAPADGPLTFATWDDDPGSYIIASLMSHVTGSDSPYPGLKLAQALLVAIPLLWLPLAVARVVGRARAGFALVVLPLVTWLFNHGAVLVGTEYGLSDRVSALPVYSLYGTAASLAFLSLSLVVLLSTYRLRMPALIGATLGIGVLAGFGNLSRSLSGLGVAAAVGVLWWIHARGRWRWVAAIGGALAAILVAVTIQTGVMAAINATRVETTGQPMEEVPDAHTAWHSLYLGLSYPQPIDGQPSRFDVTWSDEYGWAKAREVDPEVLIASEEYDEILRGLYFEEVLSHPLGAVKLYFQKAMYVATHFGGLLLLIVVGFTVGLARRSTMRPRLRRVIAIATPMILLGLVPAVMVMPMLYYYSELAAALGVLAAVSLGILAWAVTSWPSRVRAQERRRGGALGSADEAGSVAAKRADMSAIVPLVGTDSLDAALPDGAHESVTECDEIVVIGDPASESSVTAGSWPAPAPMTFVASTAGIGDRLRAGLLASTGERVRLVQPDPGDVRRSAFVEFLRKVVLRSEGVADARVLTLDGAWARQFAATSRETGSLWFDELAFASELCGIAVERSDGGDAVAATRQRGRFGDTWRALSGFIRIALRREEYRALAGVGSAASHART